MASGAVVDRLRAGTGGGAGGDEDDDNAEAGDDLWGLGEEEVSEAVLQYEGSPYVAAAEGTELQRLLSARKVAAAGCVRGWRSYGTLGNSQTPSSSCPDMSVQVTDEVFGGALLSCDAEDGGYDELALDDLDDVLRQPQPSSDDPLMAAEYVWPCCWRQQSMVVGRELVSPMGGGVVAAASSLGAATGALICGPPGAAMGAVMGAKGGAVLVLAGAGLSRLSRRSPALSSLQTGKAKNASGDGIPLTLYSDVAESVAAPHDTISKLSGKETRNGGRGEQWWWNFHKPGQPRLERRTSSEAVAAKSSGKFNVTIDESKTAEGTSAPCGRDAPTSYRRYSEEGDVASHDARDSSAGEKGPEETASGGPSGDTAEAPSGGARWRWALHSVMGGGGKGREGASDSSEKEGAATRPTPTPKEVAQGGGGILHGWWPGAKSNGHISAAAVPLLYPRKGSVSGDGRLSHLLRQPGVVEGGDCKGCAGDENVSGGATQCQQRWWLFQRTPSANTAASEDSQLSVVNEVIVGADGGSIGLGPVGVVALGTDPPVAPSNPSTPLPGSEGRGEIWTVGEGVVGCTSTAASGDYSRGISTQCIDATVQLTTGTAAVVADGVQERHDLSAGTLGEQSLEEQPVVAVAEEERRQEGDVRKGGGDSWWLFGFSSASSKSDASVEEGKCGGEGAVVAKSEPEGDGASQGQNEGRRTSSEDGRGGESSQGLTSGLKWLLGQQQRVGPPRAAVVPEKQGAEVAAGGVGGAPFWSSLYWWSVGGGQAVQRRGQPQWANASENVMNDLLDRAVDRLLEELIEDAATGQA